VLVSFGIVLLLFFSVSFFLLLSLSCLPGGRLISLCLIQLIPLPLALTILLMRLPHPVIIRLLSQLGIIGVIYRLMMPYLEVCLHLLFLLISPKQY